MIVLIDDMGFGQPSTFGGAIHMPTLDRLADEGLRYNNFHATALCSPTRAALLTGRNHHSNNTGAVQDIATAFPGNTGVRPQSIAPLAEILRLNGYNTAAFGKWHLTPPGSRASPARSTVAHALGLRQVLRLPRRRDEPVGAAPLRRPHRGRARRTIPNYHFTTDMTNHAIAWIRPSTR